MGKSWKNPIKVANAAKKGALFTKVIREVQVSAKLGGPDPASNSRLRMAIDAAREVSCPNDTIDRAIKKGAGLLDDGHIIEEVTYEGYGPHGVGIMVECQTDNRNRTVPEIRTAFKSHGGNLGESGSVGWMFTRVGFIEGKKTGTFDPEEEAIEAGADEVYKADDHYMFYMSLDQLETVRHNLINRGWTVSKSEPSFKPNQITQLSPEQYKEVEALLFELDEHDDSHRVYATLPIV